MKITQAWISSVTHVWTQAYGWEDLESKDGGSFLQKLFQAFFWLCEVFVSLLFWILAEIFQAGSTFALQVFISQVKQSISKVDI